MAPVAAAVLGGLGAPLLHRYGTKITNWLAGRPNEHGEGRHRRRRHGGKKHRGGSMIMRGPAMGNHKIKMSMRKRIGYKRGAGYLSGPLA